MIKKRWQVAEPISSGIKQAHPNIDGLLLQLLWNRGLRTAGAMTEFLEPDWTHGVHDPYFFRDMGKAVECIYEAIGAKQRVAVFGDYDADGVTAAVILVDTLKRLGADVIVYLPHREREGYGLNETAVKYLCDQQAKIIITCDCGIASVDQVALANELGAQVIITDHHQPQPELPAAYAILHPGLAGETYPFNYLSGGGVAFKLVQGLLQYDGCPLDAAEREKHIKWLLDLVAISTVADMVPLKGESRTLTKYGLTVLRKTRRLGLKKLIEAAGLRFETLDTYSIGFQIAPRINAAGRMDHANAAYALLVSQQEAEATELARSLNLTNMERQKRTDEMYLTAKAQIGVPTKHMHLVHAYVAAWSLGMVGLVAGKLVQEYGRPALVLCDNGELVAGSGRSIPQFDLVAALTSCRKLLNNFGGHKQAAGFSLPKKNLEAFLENMSSFARKHLDKADLDPIIEVDAEVELKQVGWELEQQVHRLEPTGQQNPPARFVSRGLVVASTSVVGSSGQHLRLALENSGQRCKFIWFGQGKRAVDLTPGTEVDVVFEPGVNDWNGQRELELRVVDLVVLD